MPKKRMCYFIPVDGFIKGEGFRVSIVTEDESGHSPSGTWPCAASDVRPYFWGNDYDKAVALAAVANSRLGHSPEDVTQIIASSMGSVTTAQGA